MCSPRHRALLACASTPQHANFELLVLVCRVLQADTKKQNNFRLLDVVVKISFSEVKDYFYSKCKTFLNSPS